MTYSKSSKREREKELLKIQQDRREGVIQNPARQRVKELFKIQHQYEVPGEALQSFTQRATRVVTQ